MMSSVCKNGHWFFFVFARSLVLFVPVSLSTLFFFRGALLAGRGGFGSKVASSFVSCALLFFFSFFFDFVVFELNIFGGFPTPRSNIKETPLFAVC